MEKLSVQQIKTILHFWMRVLEVEDQQKRDTFKLSLFAILQANHPRRLYNDYDPQGELLECVRAAGVECKGHMFSGKGIFPQKTGTEHVNGMVRVKVGYGNTLGMASTPEDVDTLLKGYRVGPNWKGGEPS